MVFVMVEQNIQFLPVGYILEKKYQILDVIGSGAFGITYLVKHLTFSHHYVIKEYLPQVAVRHEEQGIKPIDEQDQELFDWGLNQFIKEAKLLNQLKHPNIVTVIDIFEDNGSAYFVMPFLGKYTLSQWIDEHQQPTIDELYKIFIPLLEGLKYIHEKDLYHGDIKPENILIADNGIPILIDFGLARHSSLGGDNTAMVLTPPYAPIEQYSSTYEFRPSLDLYSLMVCLYESITKQLIPDAPKRMSQDNLEKLSDDKNYQEKYPINFLQAIDKSLSLEAKNRYQSAMDLQHALLDYQEKIENPPSKSKAYLVIAVVALLGLGGYAYYDMNDTKAVKVAEFDYQVSLPINGKRQAVVTLQDDFYIIDVIEVDNDRNWKLINSLSFDYVDNPDTLLREIRYKILNFNIKDHVNIIIKNNDANNERVSKFIEYIKFTYGDKPKDISMNLLSDKQVMEYLFMQSIPVKYQNRGVLFYRDKDKDIFAFKDKDGELNFYQKLDNTLLQEHDLYYIFMIKDKLSNSEKQHYYQVQDRATLPKEIAKLNLTPVLVNTDIGISFLLKNEW